MDTNYDAARKAAQWNEMYSRAKDIVDIVWEHTHAEGVGAEVRLDEKDAEREIAELLMREFGMGM